jgi:metal-sulfur cluster biosynthetic enzyme
MLTAVADEPDAQLAHTIWAKLDSIKDPCHVLSGHDLSIVDLGLVNRVDVVDDQIEVGITFTDSTCLFAYKIIGALEDLAIPGVRQVRVVPEPFPLWDESRLSAKARALYADKARQFGFHEIVRAGRGDGPSANGRDA